ncbi:MAG TPA: hypothetical protein VFX53_08730 [Pedococcus sp.]|nr:hypothetical protein [Pedococcus sp.]
MSIRQPPPDSGYAPTPMSALEPGRARHHTHGHMLMVLLMCAPMLLFVGVLVLTGRVTGGSVLGALLCVGMMAAMGMHGGHAPR